MIDEAISQTVVQLVDAWNSHDIKAFVSLFTEDADYVSSAGQWLRGREAIEREFSKSQAVISKVGEVLISDPWIRYLKSDVALVHYKWKLITTKGSQGEGAALREGIITQVFIYEESGWRIVSLHNTDIGKAFGNGVA